MAKPRARDGRGEPAVLRGAVRAPRRSAGRLQRMQLRNYQSSDLEALLVLWWNSWHSSASFRHPRPPAEWRRRWENILKHHSVVVVESNGALVGFAALDIARAVLSQIFVAPDAKRRGIGRRLFGWALSRCPNGLTLKTLAENAESRAFYRSLGMVEQGRSVNDFSGREEIEYAISSGRRATSARDSTTR